MQTPRRLLAGLAALAAAVGVAVSAPPPASAADDAVIRSGQLAVSVDRAFPRVLGYTWRATGEALGGATGADGADGRVRIDGVSYTPSVDASVHEDGVDYTLTTPVATVDATLSVSRDVLTFAVTRVSGTMSTFAIPGQSLVSVAAGHLSAGSVFRGDKHVDVATTAPDAQPQRANMAIVDSGTLAAAVWSNAIQTDGPLQYQVSGSPRSGGVWSNTWTYRGDDGSVVALPSAKVVVTQDRNGDGTTDWQDGAIAYRDVMPVPYQGRQTRDDVVSQIAMNIASLAQHPFIRTLDDIKKSYLLTDHLGQSIELKGYQDQGHDSAHPDYAGHYNTSAGGLADLRYLVDHAGKYGARIGVHVNDTEEYPEANGFRWDMSTQQPCWAWMDQSWCIDREQDLTQHSFQHRIAALKDDVPNLSWVYVDTFGGQDWQAYEVAHTLNGLGWGAYTEFAGYMWPNAVWAHQPNEYDDIGVGSQLLRFAYNSYMDEWSRTDNPMLMGENNLGFMGWHTQNDVNAWLKTVFTNNLPTKFLQHYQITSWRDHQIDFTGGVTSSDASGHTRISQDGRLIVDGGNVFIPWDPDHPSKIYAWSDDGGSATWTLPPQWAGRSSVDLYRLTDTGRVRVSDLPVNDGKVTLDLDANTPYAVYPGDTSTGATGASVDFGAGGMVKDPEFYSGSFADWHRSGDTAATAIGTDTNGFQDLRFAGSGDASVEQTVHGLADGHTYSASAWVQVNGGRRATLSVGGYGGPAASTWVDTSPVENAIGANPRYGSHFQRIKVLFTVPKGHDTATLRLSAAAGSGTAEFADVRLVRDDGADESHAGGHYYTDDFEHVDQGWGPFVYTGQSSDPQTHLSERHAGYTRDTIAGEYSLKARDEAAGTVYRTWPGSLRLDPSHVYRVAFDYQSDAPNRFTFHVGADGDCDDVVSAPLAQTTSRSLDSKPPAGDPKPSGWTDSLPPQGSAPHAGEVQTFATGPASCGDPYLAIAKNAGSGDVVIDNLVVDDLGQAPDGDAGKALGRISVPDTVVGAGSSGTTTVTYTNTSGETQTGVKLSLTSPDGWAVEATTPTTFASLAPGESARASYRVSVPDGTGTGTDGVAAMATYGWNGHDASTTGAGTITVPPPAPTGDTYVGDMQFVKAQNGYGNLQRDKSEGGHTITIRGATYAKGIGTNSPSDVQVYLGGRCTTLTAVIGLDDDSGNWSESSGHAQATFSVLGDGTRLYDSPTLYRDSAAVTISVDVSGVQLLDLVSGVGPDGTNFNDHTDWADARLQCST